MLRDESVVVESGWAGGDVSEAWRDLDRQLCSVAKRRGALDQEELMLIREAVAVQLWRPLGMTSMREYLERRMGYGPQVAAERLRVAEALDALPELDEALAENELSYSAVRELTRIATPKTAGAWVKACRGKVLRQIEELVAEREPGDEPESKPKPQVRPRRFAADLRPDVHALVRQARQVLEAEYGEKLDNDELMQAFAARVLERPPASGKVQRPRHQIAVTVCPACKQGWQTGAGREVPISALDVEVALCDAQHVDEHGKLTPSIPAATRRAVWRRDHGRCTIPGCRASCFIDVHHLVPRALGGTHEMSNLALQCAGHHRALHAGLIVLEGSAPDFKVIRVSEVPVRDSCSESGLRATTGAGVKAEPRRGIDADELPHVGDSCSEAGLRGATGDRDPACIDDPRDDIDADELPQVGDSCSEAGLRGATGDRDPACIDDARDDVDADELPHVGDSCSEAGLRGATGDRDPACIDDARDDVDADKLPHVGDSCSEAGLRGATGDRDPACIDDARDDIDADKLPHVGDSCSEAGLRGATGAGVQAEPCDDVEADGIPHVGDVRQMATDVEAGLVRLGFRRAEARDAVARARARVVSTDVETLMRAALRECPRPTR